MKDTTAVVQISLQVDCDERSEHGGRTRETEDFFKRIYLL